MSRLFACCVRPRVVVLAVLGLVLAPTGCDLNPRPEDPSGSKGFGPELGATGSGGGSSSGAGGASTIIGAGSAGVDDPLRYDPPPLGAVTSDTSPRDAGAGSGGQSSAPGADAMVEGSTDAAADGSTLDARPLAD